jgi:NAD+--dinitrogen-reductase ADP-D-ribosyltransferase
MVRHQHGGCAGAVLASVSFNQTPQPLHVAGVHAAHMGRCSMRWRIPKSAAEARELFAHYMREMFVLDRPATTATPEDAHRWRVSYLKLLQGWGLDANGAAGAVLKGWAESRFGLLPAFHKAPLGRFPSPAWVAYLQDKGAAPLPQPPDPAAIGPVVRVLPVDAGATRLAGPEPVVTLWRGSNRIEEQVVSGSLRARRCTVRLNNIVSFSTTREQAGWFGDWLLCARVPLCKLLLVPGLLDTRRCRAKPRCWPSAACTKWRPAMPELGPQHWRPRPGGVIVGPRPGRLPGPGAGRRAGRHGGIHDAARNRPAFCAQGGVHRDIIGGGWLKLPAGAGHRRHHHEPGTGRRAAAGPAAVAPLTPP